MGANALIATPRTIGRYEIHGEIASGGMATVHLGKLQGQVGFSRTVAIKRLHPQYAKDPDFVAMFIDEARLAGRIRHPNVVPVLDVIGLEGELFLVMEYVQGESLGRLLRICRDKGKRPSLRIVCTVMVGVLEGLHAAHEAVSEHGDPLGIVHRDVSPQNVLVGMDGLARVLDFGIAKASRRLQTTRDGQVKGKIAYMAQEQLRGGLVDRRTDVYSAAAVLWEALTGKKIFEAEDDIALYGMVLEAPIRPPSAVVETIPPGLDAVVLRGLERDPTKRFQTAEEMALALERAVGTASKREVGRWVERSAADSLRLRAEKVAEIESATSAVNARIRTGVSASHPIDPHAVAPPTVADQVQPDPEVSDAFRRASALDEPSFSSVSIVSAGMKAEDKGNDIPVVVSEPPPARWKQGAMAGVLLLSLVLVGAGAWLIFRGDGDAVPEPHPTTSAGVSASALEAETTVAPTSAGEPTATASSSPTSSPSAPVASAPPVTTRTGAKRPPPTRRPPRPPKPPPVSTLTDFGGRE